MIEELEMQARVVAASHRMMKVEPREPEHTLEWKAAKFIKENLI